MSIEEREDGLGELPEPLRLERNENVGYTMRGSRYDGYGVPPYDVRQQHNVLDAESQIGSIPRAFEVTSTYDARPVNARDFLVSFELTFNLDACFSSYIEEDTFQVPNGYVGVLRGFKYAFNPPAQIDTDILVTIISDDVSLNDYTQVPLPQVVNDFIPVYGISNPLKFIGIRIEHPPQSSSLDLTTICKIQIHGNLLLSRGIPSQYEPANKIF